MLWSFLLSLSFYSDWFGFLAWISLARPILILTHLRGREAFNAGYFFYFFFNLFTIYWVAMVSPPGMIAAVVILGFYGAAALSLFVRAYHIRPILGFILMPIMWTALEYFRTLSEFAFPWSDLGYTQSYYLYIIQIVSVISAHGLTLLIVAINVLLAQLLRKEVSVEKKLTSAFISVGIVAGLTAFGWVVVPAHPVDGTYKVTLLQGSVPLDIKWEKGNQEHSYAIYDSLSMSARSDSSHLMIWPETSAPAYLTHRPEARERIGGISVRSDCYHLVGGLGAIVDSVSEKHYNSCYQFAPNGRIEKQHDKVKLVPFAEHVPYQDELPFLSPDVLTKYLTFIKTYNVQWWSDFYPGDSATVFELPDAYYAVLICFESTFPDYVRQTVLNGAEFMVGITNDSWFGESVGIFMHSRIFITRIVENRIWGARVANSGLSYIVDDYGRIREELEINEVAALSGGIRRIDGFSVFTRVGNLAGLLSFLIALIFSGILLVLWIWRKFQKLS